MPEGAKTAGDMMRDLLSNKTIAFIGDSINNLVFRAFLCEIAKEDYITYKVRRCASGVSCVTRCTVRRAACRDSILSGVTCCSGGSLVTPSPKGARSSPA